MPQCPIAGDANGSGSTFSRRFRSEVGLCLANNIIVCMCSKNDELYSAEKELLDLLRRKHSDD